MGIPTLISTSTASNAANISITSGIDSTYDEYMFVFTDINPATDEDYFQFQVNATDTADYDDVPITSTWFSALHKEDDQAASLAYIASHDLANTASFQRLTPALGGGSDESCAGILHLFNPSSTTYVKHFYARVNLYNSANQSQNSFIAGYFNDTTAIDDIQFKMSSGNLDGVIQLFGIS